MAARSQEGNPMNKTMLAIILVTAAGPAMGEDVAGSEDHPLITRYPGSTITWYDVQGHEAYKIAVGPVTGYRQIDEWVEAEGKLTRINYELAGQTSMYDVYANYLEALEQSGFEVLAKGYDKSSSPQGAVGQRGFLDVHYRANPIPPGTSRLLQGSATSAGSGYVAARLDRPQGTVYVVAGTAQYQQDLNITLVDIIETKAVETGLVTVDAEAMSKDIDNTGKTVLHGLFFDYDQATLTDESKPALEEIAKLLDNRSHLKAYVVGHTDMSGSLDYNLDLSEARAQAVVDALTSDYGIAAERLAPHGVGPLAPVATNQADAGKARNRRVELVER